jgi:hypothetical protein
MQRLGSFPDHRSFPLRLLTLQVKQCMSLEWYTHTAETKENPPAYTNPLPAIFTVSNTACKLPSHSRFAKPDSDADATCSLRLTRSTLLDAANAFRLLCLVRKTHDTIGNTTNKMKNVVSLDVVKWGAKDALTRERRVGCEAVDRVTWTFVRGADAADDDVSDASRVASSDGAWPFGSGLARPRGVGVAVPSEETLDDTDAAAGEASGCIGAVVDLLTGTTVCVDVEEADNDGVGEWDLGVGVADGDLDNDPGRCEARLSAC